LSKICVSLAKIGKRATSQSERQVAKISHKATI